MATAIELITRALRVARVIGKDQTPDAEESNDAFSTLNWMLDQWWIQSLAVYVIEKQSWTWTANDPSWSVGPAGDYGMTRPVKIVPGCSVSMLGVDYGLEILTNSAQYDRIANKTTAGIPQYVYYDPVMPEGVLYLWPVPAQNMTFNLRCYQRVTNIAGLASTVDLPPAYEMAIIYNLAQMLAPEYGVAVTPDLEKQARKSLALIKRNNLQPMVMTFDPIASPYVRNIP